MQQNDKKLLQAFGKHLKKKRIKIGTSLNSLMFNKGGTTSATLSRIENGLVDFKFSTLVKISAAMEIPLAKLLEDFDYKYEIQE
ncbi:MAG: helix-turn-helix transcriptional regulator [Candidatus Gastranaerophilales bacterium]|nr:helix-turn-helix transcriptional regulator [Candidatus Gastranaerophilales bacterium]